MREDIVIVAAGRTALGNFGGTLSALPASELGATVIKGLLERSGLQPSQIEAMMKMLQAYDEEIYDMSACKL